MKGNTNTTDLRVAEIEDSIAIVKGRTPSTVSAETSINYPSGFTRDNCMIISANMLVGTTRYLVNSVPGMNIMLSMNNNNIYIGTSSTTNTAWLDKNTSVMLKKLT